MEQLLIEGGVRLKGQVEVSGAKNAALPILAAATLTQDVCVIENVPNILDIQIMMKGIECLGAKVTYQNGRVTIDGSGIKQPLVDSEYMQQIRGSYYLLGALLGRFKHAQVIMPGGCNLGTRPIDQHIKSFEALGARTKIEHGFIIANEEKAPLIGTSIYLDIASVGATINSMMAAVLAEGRTVIENPAKEPHVVDLANFLNSMGADIKGAGTDVIRIKGVSRLHGCEYSIIPDQIEAGTFMVAAAITGGDVVVKNLIPKHMEAISAKLLEMNVKLEEREDAIRVYVDEPLRPCNLKTLYYPGLPTDMQPQMTALLSLIEGTSIVTETVYIDRFQYVEELLKMGADITVEGNTAIIKGVPRLLAADVKAKDLRAGAALVLAGLAAQGQTGVFHLDYIDRGYERIEEKLQKLGANIKRVSFDNVKSQLRVV